MSVQENFTQNFKIARNYVIIRKVFNKAPSEIEAETKISKQNLSTWENGRGNPGQGFIDQLSGYFGLPREVFYMDDLTPEYVENIKNNTHGQNKPAIQQNTISQDAARLYAELYEKFLGNNSQYLVIHRDVLKEHRLVSVEQYAEDKERLIKERVDMEKRSDEVQSLLNSLRDIATRPININLSDVQRTKE